MTFPVLAFFSRTMRVQARSWRTYIFRACLALLLWGFLALSQFERLSRNAPGLELFGILIGANLFVLCTLALIYFATAITEEKEEMTLGLLKLAGLSPVSILMGKSTSRLLGLGMLLLVQVPFAMLAVTLGGVSVTQILAAYLMLLAFTWFLCNLSLCCSVVASRSRIAAPLAVVLLVAFFLLPRVGRAMSSILVGETDWTQGDLIIRIIDGCSASMIETSPFTRTEQIMRVGFAGPVVGYQAVASFIWGSVFFLIAWVLFNPCTRKQKQAAPARGLVPKSGILRRPLGVGRPWKNALAWKEFHFMTGGRTKIIVKSIVFAVVAVVTAGLSYAVESDFGFGMRSQPVRMGKVADVTGAILTVGILAVTALEMGVYASRIFSSEVKWQTLSSIMGLPIGVEELVRQKIRGCLPTFLPNLVLFCVAAIIGHRPVGEALEAILTESEIFMGFLYGFSQFLLFLTFTAFLSLYVKWGGVVLAFVIQFIAQYFVLISLAVMSIAPVGDGLGFGILLAAISIGLAFLFGFLVTVRLTTLASAQT